MGGWDRTKEVDPAKALAATKPVRERGASPTLRVTLAALGQVQRGEREDVTLGSAEVRELLVHVQELRRDVGAAELAIAEGRATATAKLKRDVESWLKRGEELLGRLE